jgi:glycosyltransferase involved in cell wall biosynthesis
LKAYGTDLIKMRILFTTDQIYLHGGIEKVMAEKASYFADVLGYELYILTTEQKNNPACYPLSDKVKLVDISINYNRNVSYFHPENLFKTGKHLRKWRQIVKEIRPDIMISCNYAFDFYWTPFFFRTVPKLKEYHSSRYFQHQVRMQSGFLKNIKHLVNDFVEAKFDKLILLNADEKLFYKSPNTVVIPNSLEIPAAMQAELRNKRAIAAGRIAPVKGFESLIEAWKNFSGRIDGWQLDIFGHGEKDYIDQLKQLIEDNKLTSQVRINKATNDLRGEMLQSSFFAMSSHTECYPMVLLESLSIGLPVVTFDCPTGPRHIITDGADGFLVEDQNVAAYADKIVSLASDTELLRSFGNHAKQHASKFSNDIVMQKWVSLFKFLSK